MAVDVDVSRGATVSVASGTVAAGVADMVGAGGLVGAAAGVQLATRRRNMKTIQVEFRIISTTLLNIIVTLYAAGSV